MGGRLAGDAAVGQRGRGGAEAGDGRHRLEAGAPGSLLIAADHQRADPQAPAHEESAHAGGPTELVGGHGQQIGAELVEGDGIVPGAGGGVDVHEHPPLAARGHDRRDGLAGAHLVVPPLDVDEAGVLAHRAHQLVGVDAAVAVDADDRHLAVGLRREADRRVLDGRQHLVTAALGGSPAGAGDRLRRSAREHDRPRSGPQQRGDLLPRRLHRDPCLQPLRMDPPRIPARPGQPVRDRSNRLRPQTAK